MYQRFYETCIKDRRNKTKLVQQTQRLQCRYFAQAAFLLSFLSLLRRMFEVVYVLACMHFVSRENLKLTATICCKLYRLDWLYFRKDEKSRKNEE